MQSQLDEDQIKYAQQHLANERTYLAWVRTSIAIVGIGFLTTSLHFTIATVRNALIDALTFVLFVFSCFFGIFVISVAMKTFQKNRQAILNGSFFSIKSHITLLSILMMVFIFLIFIYFFFILVGSD